MCVIYPLSGDARSLSSLFEKQSWRLAYVSLRRFPHDRRAQRHFVNFAVVLVLFVGCVVADVAMLLAHAVDPWLRGMVLAVVSVALLGSGVRAVYMWLQERLEQRAALPSVSEDVRVGLAGQTVTLALLLQRAGSEECLAEKELHPSIVVTTRADGIARLKQHNLYAGLRLHSRGLFLLPDGEWSEEHRARIFTCWEDFEALRWAMSLSRDLVSIEYAPKHGWRDVLRIARGTENAIRKARLRPAWEIRPKRDEAKKYLDRCVSRMVTAGLIDAVPENANWQRKMEEIYERETHADLLVGHEYIREVDAPTLVWTAHRAARRLEILTVLTKIVSDESQPQALERYLEEKFSPVGYLDSEFSLAQ